MFHTFYVIYNKFTLSYITYMSNDTIDNKIYQ